MVLLESNPIVEARCLEEHGRLVAVSIAARARYGFVPSINQEVARPDVFIETDR